MIGLLPLWPGWHTMPAPAAKPEIRWSDRAREALTPDQFPPAELLWRSGNPDEFPLVIPAWARSRYPELAEALDAGYEMRRAAGLEDGR